MNTSQVVDTLDLALPDALVLAHARAFLVDNARDGFCHLELDNGYTPIPVDAPLSMITKAFFKEYHGDPLGPYKCLVAVGEPKKQAYSSSIVLAEYCLFTLFFNAQCQMITLDFHEEWR